MKTYRKRKKSPQFQAGGMMTVLGWVRGKIASFHARAKLSKFPKFRFFVKYVIPTLGFIVAAATLVIKHINPGWKDRNLCRQGIEVARGLARQDKFEEALATLDNVRKTCASAWIRQDDDVLRAELEAFKAVIEYDQIKRVRKKDLEAVEEKWRYVNEQYPNRATTMALRGIIEELNYNPVRAIEQYRAAIEADPEYIAAHIRLGYVYFKWKLEGSNWATKAEKHFDDAANVAAISGQDSDRKNAWPYINKAAVHIDQAQTLLDDKCADSRSSKCDDAVIGDVRSMLAKALPNLEKAMSLMQNDINPRLHLLWGHYYSCEGILRRTSGLGDPDDLFHAAKEYLIKVTDINSNIADAYLLLGAVYEELSKNKTPPTRDDYKRQALAEYRKAVTLDRCNIIARLAYASALFDQKRRIEAAEQSQEGVMLIDEFDKDLDERSRRLNRDDLREWLKKTSEEYKQYRQVFLHIMQTSRSPLATAALIHKAPPACQ